MRSATSQGVLITIFITNIIKSFTQTHNSRNRLFPKLHVFIFCFFLILSPNPSRPTIRKIISVFLIPQQGAGYFSISNTW